MKLEKCPICGLTEPSHILDSDQYRKCYEKYLMLEHKCCFYCACQIRQSKKYDINTFITEIETESGIKRIRYQGYYAPKDYKGVRGCGGRLMFVHFTDNRPIPYMFFNNVWCQGDVHLKVCELADAGDERFKNLVTNAKLIDENEYRKWYESKMQEINTGDIYIGVTLKVYEIIPMIYDGYEKCWYSFDMKKCMFITDDNHKAEMICFLSDKTNLQTLRDELSFRNVIHKQGIIVDGKSINEWVSEIQDKIRNKQQNRLEG